MMLNINRSAKTLLDESCSLQVIGSSLEPRKGLNLVSKTPTGGQGKERGLLYCWRPT